MTPGGLQPDSGIAQPSKRLSIRLRIMIVAIIAIVPFLLERIYNEEVDRADRIADANKQTLALARQAAATQNEVIVSVRAFLNSIASARTTFDASNESCNRFLAKIAAPLPWIQALSVANVQGRIICSSFPAAIGLDISTRPHFIKAIDSGDFVVSDFFNSSRTGAPVITAALAQVGENGGAAAVVLAVLDLRWFGQLVSAFPIPGGAMLMLDSHGTVLAEYPKSRNLVGRQFGTHPLVRHILAHNEGSTTQSGLDDVRRIYGFVRLPNTGAHFAVGFSEKEVLARANREMLIALFELGVMVALALLAIWFGGERLLVRPIRALTQTAVQIGRGELKTSAAKLPWAAEFVPLAVALDDMSDKLAARENELRDRNAQLHELAHVDALTALGNRRTFNQRLVDEWAAAAQLQKPIAILMIDVDHFKKFNDHYGHVQGDICLRKIADILKAGTRSDDVAKAKDRPQDFAARYGGEEFAILLPGADSQAAAAVGARLRRAVEDMLMAHAGAPWGFVSISIGVGSLVPAMHNSAQDLTESADAALYEAKQRGRNKVIVYSAAMLAKAS